MLPPPPLLLLAPLPLYLRAPFLQEVPLPLPPAPVPQRWARLAPLPALLPVLLPVGTVLLLLLLAAPPQPLLWQEAPQQRLPLALTLASVLLQPPWAASPQLPPPL